MILRRMAQILCARNPDYLILVRTYGTRRTKRNHYEVLCISPSSTQKEIKSAYVKLSKELHPDTSKKDSHKEFVEINEAYRVLSKEKTKREYDASLSHRTVDPRRTYNHNHRQNGSYDSYDQRRDFYNEWYHSVYTNARRSRGYNVHQSHAQSQAMRENSKRIAVMCVICMIFGTIIQFLLIKHSVTLKRDKMFEQSRKLEEEFEMLTRAAEQRETYEEKEAFILELVRRQEEYINSQSRNKKPE